MLLIFDIRFKDGLELRPSGKYRISEDGGKVQLIVKGVNKDDTGDITCEISNPKGRDTAVAKLQVQSKDSVTIWYFIIYGNNIILNF